MRVRTGTSGFGYAAWRGAFYPRDVPSRLWLSYYASRLETVEANATFYRMPRGATLAAWRGQVPAGFVFALKAPQRVTHGKRLRDASGLLRTFHAAAAELGPTLGPMLFQLPPTLRRDLPLLVEFLDALPRRTRAAFEFRHASWLEDGVYAALHEHGAALCIADTEEATTPPVATARFGYLRLRRAEYARHDLERWVRWLRERPWDEAFVYFKHEDEARGPAFALALRQLLDAPADGGAVRPEVIRC